MLIYFLAINWSNTIQNFSCTFLMREMNWAATFVEATVGLSSVQSQQGIGVDIIFESFHFLLAC